MRPARRPEGRGPRAGNVERPKRPGAALPGGRDTHRPGERLRAPASRPRCPASESRSSRFVDIAVPPGRAVRRMITDLPAARHGHYLSSNCVAAGGAPKMRTGRIAMLQVAFAGTFSSTLEPSVRARLAVPCDIVLGDESGIVARLSDVDVLVTLAFTREMGAAAKRLKLVQVPGAGLDRIDRTALPAGASLANAYGHEVGIAEYVDRRDARADTRASAGSTRRSGAGCGRASGVWARARPAAVARAGGQDARHPRLWPDRAGAGPARPRLRHGGLRDPARRGALEPGRALVPRRACRSRRGLAARGLSGRSRSRSTTRRAASSASASSRS